MEEKLNNKTCGDCRNRYSDEGTCPVKWGVTDTDDARKCDTFEPRTITYGDRIRQMSDEELAEKFIYTRREQNGDKYYLSTITVGKWDSRAEAKAATVEELKKEVKDE